MEYTKIKVSSKDDPKRFYRILAVQGNPDLYTLGAIIGKSVNVWFEHFYMFRSKKVSFVPDQWLEEALYWNEDLAMSKYNLSDLGSSFVYEYDTGEGYEFACKVYKKKINYDVEDGYLPIAFVVEGKGQGIFENDHRTLWMYLAGQIKADATDDEENYNFLPMNMSFTSFGDFDAPLDIEDMMYYKEEINTVVNHFRSEPSQEQDEDDDFLENEEEINSFMYKVAGDIFLNPDMNKLFRRLIETHDINDAYEMIVKTIAKTISSMDEDADQAEFDEAISNALNSLE